MRWLHQLLLICACLIFELVLSSPPDGVSLLDVAPSAKCASTIRAAKATCNERLSDLRRQRASICGPPELPTIMEEIRKGHQKSKELQVDLKSAESAMQSVKHTEIAAVAASHKTKHTLTAALVNELKDKNNLQSDKVEANKQAQKQLEAQKQAHRATLDAVRLAEESPDMDKVEAEAAKATALWHKMVEEQIAVGRAKYKKKKSVKKNTADEDGVSNLLDKAKAARLQEKAAMDHVKDTTQQVSRINVQLSRNEVKTAHLEVKAANAQKSFVSKADAKEKAAAKTAAATLKAAQASMKKTEEVYDDATQLQKKLQGMNLKGVLASANRVLTPAKEDGAV